MIRSRSWKKADYPNRKPAWQKIRIHNPLRNWKKAKGFADTRQQAEGMAKALKLYGNKTKIIETPSGWAVYYQKRYNKKYVRVRSHYRNGKKVRAYLRKLKG